jgi:hypothetical protein
MISKAEVATENIATRCVAVLISGETAEADMAAFYQADRADPSANDSRL